MNIDIKKKTNIKYNNYSGVAPESYQVRPESLETFEPILCISASSKVKNENDAIQNRSSDSPTLRISQPKNQ